MSHVTSVTIYISEFVFLENEQNFLTDDIFTFSSIIIVSVGEICRNIGSYTQVISPDRDSVQHSENPEEEPKTKRRRLKTLTGDFMRCFLLCSKEISSLIFTAASYFSTVQRQKVICNH